MDSPDTTIHSDTADTETFTESELEDGEIKCEICAVKCFESVDSSLSVQIIQNTVWLNPLIIGPRGLGW